MIFANKKRLLLIDDYLINHYASLKKGISVQSLLHNNFLNSRLHLNVSQVQAFIQYMINYGAFLYGRDKGSYRINLGKLKTLYIHLKYKSAKSNNTNKVLDSLIQLDDKNILNNVSSDTQNISSHGKSSLYVTYNGMPNVKMNPSQIFQSPKYTNLDAISYSVSKNFLLRYCSGFSHIIIIQGLVKKSLLCQVYHALNNIKYKHMYKNYSLKPNYELRFPPTFSIHSKIYLLSNPKTHMYRVITGSANLSFAAMGNHSHQVENINIIDGLSTQYKANHQRFQSLYNKTLRFTSSISTKLSNNINENRKIFTGKKESSKKMPAEPKNIRHNHDLDAWTKYSEKQYYMSLLAAYKHNKHKDILQLNDIYCLIGKDYIHLNEYNKAIIALKMSLYLEKKEYGVTDNVTILYLIARSYLYIHKNNQAKLYIRKICSIKHYPSNMTLLTKLSKLISYVNPSKAAVVCRYAVNRLQSRKALKYLIQLDIKLQDFSEPITLLKRLVLKFNYPLDWYYLGIVYKKRAHFQLSSSSKQKAIICFLKCLYYHSRCNKRKYNSERCIAHCLIQLHLYQVALTTLNAAKEQSPDAKHLADLSMFRAIFKVRRYNDTLLLNQLGDMEQAIMKSPFTSRYFKKLAKLNEWAGHFNIATQNYITANAIQIYHGEHPLSTQFIHNSDVYDPHYNYSQGLKMLIGMHNVKHTLMSIVDQALIARLRNSSSAHQELHLVFEGNPGTGKTTVANLLCGILYQKHVISSPKFVHVNATQVVGSRYGISAKHIRNLMQRAMGGVLFIDEAYEFAHRTDGNSACQDEAMNEFVPDIERYKNNLVVVLAGYTKPMEHFLNQSNPGLTSRFPKRERIHFHNYSGIECFKILKLYLYRHHFMFNNIITKNTMKTYIIKYVKQHSSNRYFANARSMRNIYDILSTKFSVRLNNEYSISQLRKLAQKHSKILNEFVLADVKNTKQALK